MRSKKEYNAGRITIQQPHRFIELESYANFLEEKKQIQDKYPSKPWDLHNLGQGNIKDRYNEEWWNDWVSYKKEITDLLLQTNGNFQNFLWDITPERVELEVDVYMRGRFNSIGYKNRKKNE